MTIYIRISSQDSNTILKAGMKYIDQAVKGRAQWNKHTSYNFYETECDIPEADIKPVFNGLITKYPGIDLYASYSYDIREDDRSAQWWGTTTIETVHHPDGTATLSTSSSTNWF